MIFTTDIRLAIASLKSAKVRSLLTMFAIIVGVTGYVVVTTFVDGLKGSVSEQVNSLGGNIIAVNSGNIVTKDESGEITSVNFTASVLGEPTLTEKDLNDISKIKGAETIAPQIIVSGSANISVGETKYDGIGVLASNENFIDFVEQGIDRGTFFTETNLDKKFAVIGYDLADEMFPGGSGLGKQIQLLRERFTVVGVFDKVEGFGGGFGGFDFNRAVILPINAYKELKSGAITISEIDILVDDEVDIDKLATAIDEKILDNHRGERDFTVLKQDEFIKLSDNIFDQLKAASQVLSYVMLFVGGVVIALIMMITVKERTREIGIRKSIGATNTNIMTQFLVEAVVISWVGSVLGVIIAYLLGLYIGAASGITPVYTLVTMVSVISISTLIGAISGLIPAMGAAKKDPVEALRNE